MKKKSIKSRVLIVDDHPVVRQGMTFMINQQPDMEVVFQAENAGEALNFVQREYPDLVLLDISLKKGSGLDLIADLRKARPQLPVLVLSMHDEHLYAPRAMHKGANGYIMKEAPAEAVLEAMRQVLRGGLYLSSEVKDRIIADAVQRPQGVLDDPVKTLTDRELEVMRLLGSAYSTEKIADRLGISTKTVEVHRMHIKGKLGTSTMAELVRYAVQWVAENR